MKFISEMRYEDSARRSDRDREENEAIHKGKFISIAGHGHESERREGRRAPAVPW